ncbi:tetratricopeptide repeat protein [Sphingobacterium sp. PU5-4]|uniref:Tetratricopeptide repeat protein n=1 Tax=Sphingobacterium tenebrionis TaxID=3111775 RepID=A0ABU8I3V0_9SPHI
MKGSKALKEALDEIHILMENAKKNLSSQKKDSYSKYRPLIRKSAYLGNPEGQYRYAQMFEFNNYTKNDKEDYNNKKYIYWMQKAANNGYAEAYNNLADYYERGIGVEKDLKKSFELYKKAEELGSYLGKKNSKLMEKYLKKQGVLF